MKTFFVCVVFLAVADVANAATYKKAKEAYDLATGAQSTNDPYLNNTIDYSEYLVGIYNSVEGYLDSTEKTNYSGLKTIIDSNIDSADTCRWGANYYLAVADSWWDTYYDCLSKDDADGADSALNVVVFYSNQAFSSFNSSNSFTDSAWTYGLNPTYSLLSKYVK